jgi:uncharacterized protein
MMAPKMHHEKSLELASDLSLPLDWMTLATVVYGARGSGKTSLGRVVAEEVHRLGQRFCAIDLKGDWWGLKSSADGKTDGIPVVVFGGDHQDVPLEEGAGAFVGETVATMAGSSILDLERFSKTKQVKFLGAFFAALYDTNRAPLLLLLDEAQRYAPQMARQSGQGPDVAICLGAVEDLVKLGRKHGIGPMLFTQRGSGLNKEVSELCDMLVAFRTPGPLDQERVKDWLDANATKEKRDTVMRELAGLPTGTAIVASGHPDLRTFGVFSMRRPWTFDSSATPKIGERKAEPKKLAKPDLEDLRAKMADAIERAKADDPKELRKTIGELRAALAKAEKSKAPAAPPAPKEKRVEIPIVKDSQLARIEQVHKQLEALSAKAAASVKEVSDVIIAARDLGKIALAFPPPPSTAVPARPAPAPIVFPPRPTFHASNGDLPKSKGTSESGIKKIMSVIVSRDQGAGISRQEIVIASGLKKSTVNRYLIDCSSNGWIQSGSVGAPVFATELGRKAFADAPPPAEGDALRAQWISSLANSGRGGEARIVTFLAQFGSAFVERETIDEALSMKKSTRNRYLSTLTSKSIRLVETQGTKVRLSLMLFDHDTAGE